MKKTNLIGSFMVFLLLALTLPIDTAKAAGSISDGSSVASIPLEGLSREEATELLTEHVVAWQEQEPIEAESDYETVYIPREIFIFDIAGTLDELEERMKRSWSTFFMKQKNVQIPFHVDISPSFRDELDWQEDIDIESTVNKALQLAENLSEGGIKIEYNEDATFELITLGEIERIVPEELSDSTANRIAEELNEVVITGEDSFSFLDEIILPKGMSNAEAEMSFIASILYELSLQTELEIIERYASDTLPKFTEPGLEAIVDRENGKNLLLYNPTRLAYTIEAEMIEQELVMSILTTKQESDVSYLINNEKEIAPRTIYRYSEELTGEEKIVESEGSPGLQLEIHRSITLPNEEESSELVARDFYPPQHEVILIADPTEEEVEEEEILDEASTDTLLDGATPEERAALVEACGGDPICEEEYHVSSFEKMLLECFVTNPLEDVLEVEEGTETTESNPFCDFLFTIFFLSLLSSEELQQGTTEEGFMEEEYSDEEWIDMESEYETYEKKFIEEEIEEEDSKWSEND